MVAVSTGDEVRVSALNLEDPITRVDLVYQMWRSYADFHIYLIAPLLAPVSPPVQIVSATY